MALVAAAERQIDDTSMLGNLSQGGSVGLNQRYFAGHGYEVGGIADGEPDVQRELVVHPQFDALPHILLETRNFDAQGVDAGDEVGNAVVALFVGRSGGGHCGGLIQGLHTCLRNSRTGRIGHAPQDRGAGVLCS
jgi:hypothetical protein